MLKKLKKKQEQKTEVNPCGNIATAYLPDRIKEMEDHIIINDSYCRMLVVEIIPEQIVFNWFGRITNIPGVALSVYINPYSYEEASKRVGKQMTMVGAELLTEQKKGSTRRLGVLSEKYQFFQQLLTSISLHRSNISAVIITIMITGESYKEMHYRYRRVVDILGGTKAITLYKRQIDGLKSILPMARGILPEYHDATIANAACLSPLISENFSHPSGIFFGSNRTGSPVFLDTFIGQPRLFGPHMFVVGMTRSGKSYSCKGIISRTMVHGIRTVVLDPEGEYKSLAEALDGTYIRFHPGMECMFNIFDVEPDYDSQLKKHYNDLANKQDEIASLISAMVEIQGDGKLSAEDRAVLMSAVSEEYKARGITNDPDSIYEMGGIETEEGAKVGKYHKEMPTITSLAERLRTMGAAKLARILIPFQKGGPQGYFDGQTKEKFYDSPLVVFDISALESTFAKLYASYVMVSWIWEKFVKKNRQTRKRVMIDEAWLFMKNRETAEFLSNMARRGAKYNTSLLVASQSFSEFASDEGRVLLNQCDTKFILRLKKEEADVLGRLFGLPQNVVDQVSKFTRGQGLLQSGKESAVVNFRGFEFEEHFLNSNPEAVLVR